VSDKNDGKAAEEFCRKVFVTMQEQLKFSFHRLYDMHSTGGVSTIPAQISDFLATYESIPLAIEVKSSSRHASMVGVPRSYIRPIQIAKMVLHMRSGGVGVFIFVKAGTKEFEIHDAKNVVTWYRALNKRQKLTPAAFEGKGEKAMLDSLPASFNMFKLLGQQQ